MDNLTFLHVVMRHHVDSIIEGWARPLDKMLTATSMSRHSVE